MHLQDHKPTPDKEQTPEPGNHGNWLSLAEFQAGPGIPLDDQLILINNPSIFEGYSPVRNPVFKPGRISKLRFRARHLFNAGRLNGKYFLPFRNTHLFLGYFDHSMDNLSKALPGIFKLIRRYPQRSFSLVIGKGDYRIDEALVGQIPENVSVVIANNIDVRNPKLRLLPMGRDFRNIDLLGRYAPQQEKASLCYCNFSLDTHPVRQTIYDMVKDRDFLTIEHMGKFLSYPIPRSRFLENLRSARFCLCPRGNAIDTFRMWDCLYLGTIPIVVREAVFHEDLSDLPILFLDSHTQYAELTAEFLESEYRRFSRCRFDYAKLTRQHWLPHTSDRLV